MLSLLLTALSLAPQGPGTSTAPVVINEFSYDDAGTDDLEFVELYNRTALPVDISNWTIVNADNLGPLYGGGTGIDIVYTIPAGTILMPGAFYVLGTANVPNVTQVVGTTNLLENDQESLELRDQANVIVDSLIYEAGLGIFGPHPIEGDGIYGDLAVGGNFSGSPVSPTSSIGRLLDGYDNNDNGRDFLASMNPTPGASNLAPTVTLPLLDTFDGGAVASPVPGWTRGFVPPRYEDPTSTSSTNLHPVLPSPAGGLAFSTWDNSGGGNTVQLDMAPIADVVVETYAYFWPLMAPVDPTPYSPTVPPVNPGFYNLGDGEWWGIGVRGTCAANGNPPDVGGYFGTVSLGVGTRRHFATGICWGHFRTGSMSRLYLLDLNNGAAPGNPNDYTILAGPIDIVAGLNDGWQRIRLHVQGDTVVANFGGTFGFDDGQRFVATTATSGPGAVWFAYREALLYNNNQQAGCHPPLFDLLDVHAPTTTRTFVGTPSATTVATPIIGTNGFAIPGTVGFAITGTGLVPAGSPNSMFCGLAIGFSTFAPGFPLPGAPPTAFGYVLPVAATLIGFANPSGQVSFAFPIPATTAFNGISLATQIVDFDAFLPFGLPIGVTSGMETVIGS
jgi:hypothetical protein